MAENNKEVLKAIEQLSCKVEKMGGKVDDVAEAIQTLATHMDKRFEAVDKRFEKADKSADKKIGILDQKIGKLRSDLIDHVSKTVGSAKGDIIKIIRSDREKHTLFHLKILNIFERNNLVQPEEVEALRELVAP